MVGRRPPGRGSPYVEICQRGVVERLEPTISALLAALRTGAGGGPWAHLPPRCLDQHGAVHDTALGSYLAPPALPGSLRVVRALLVVIGAISLVTGAAYLTTGPVTAAAVGESLWATVPGVGALLLSRRGAPGRPWWVWAVVAIGTLLVLQALVRVAAGEVAGLTNLVLPVALLAAVSRRSAREFFGFGRRGVPGSRDGGQTTMEYIGVVAVVAALIGVVVIAFVPGPVSQGARDLVCAVVSGPGCGSGTTSGAGSTEGAGTTSGAAPADEAGTADSSGVPVAPTPDGPWCEGVLGCVGAGAQQVGSAFWNLGGAVVDDVAGIIGVIQDPSSVVDGVVYIWNNPGDALRQMVWDDESAGMWDRGDWGGAAGRTIWNVGSWFIPGTNIAKAGDKLGDLGGLARLGSGTDELADLADAAARVQRAVDAGDLDEAADLAADAQRRADDLRTRANDAGCVSAGRGDVRIVAVGPPRGASVVVLAAGPCDVATDASRQADEAAQAARAAEDQATRSPNGAASVRLGQAGEEAVRGAYDIGPKATVVIDGRTRILDGLSDEAVTEVKNVSRQSYTQQLRDDVAYAQRTGRRFDLYVRPDTRLSAPLQDAVEQGLVTLRVIP